MDDLDQIKMLLGLSGLQAGQLSRQEQAKLDALHSELKALRAAQAASNNRSSLPQCPACGGRLEGQFKKCMHCSSELAWVAGIPCEPGKEKTVLDQIDAARRRKEREAQLARELSAKRAAETEASKLPCLKCGKMTLPFDLTDHLCSLCWTTRRKKRRRLYVICAIPACAVLGIALMIGAGWVRTYQIQSEVDARKSMIAQRESEIASLKQRIREVQQHRLEAQQRFEERKAGLRAAGWTFSDAVFQEDILGEKYSGSKSNMLVENASHPTKLPRGIKRLDIHWEDDEYEDFRAFYFQVFDSEKPTYDELYKSGRNSLSKVESVGLDVALAKTVREVISQLGYTLAPPKRWRNQIEELQREIRAHEMRLIDQKAELQKTQSQLYKAAK